MRSALGYRKAPRRAGRVAAPGGELEATPTPVAPRYAFRPGGGPNVSRHTIAPGPTAFRDLQEAFGSQRGDASAYNRFLALRARRAAGSG